MSHVGKKFKLKSGSGSVFTVFEEFPQSKIIVGKNGQHEVHVRLVDVIFLL